MHLDALRDRCLSKPGATEGFPFGPDTLVFKVAGKMFAVVGLERLPPAVVVKCEPERSVELRERYDGVSDGPYFRTIHWNYVELRGDVPSALVAELVDGSYDLVVAGLTKRARAALEGGAST